MFKHTVELTGETLAEMVEASYTVKVPEVTDGNGEAKQVESDSDTWQPKITSEEATSEKITPEEIASKENKPEEITHPLSDTGKGGDGSLPPTLLDEGTVSEPSLE